jgi:tetratricopeptide (TPR) repeat protein
MTAEEHYQRGMELFAEDQLHGAIEELEKAVAENPEHADALHALAMCYYHEGDFDKAIEFGKRLQTAQPDNTLAYTSLSMFYHAKGMIKEAEDMGALAKTLGLRDAERDSE